MSIGETLAQARRRAGLSVQEVSQRTRIRETLVKDIERDDYSACGGDFYTRGHIRAIARVVGADPEPLIEQYDAARAASAAAVEDTVPQFTSIKVQGQPQRQPPAEPRERFPPTVTREQFAPPRPERPQQRPQPAREPPAGTPLRIRPDRPDGWQPSRGPADTPQPVTPDRPGGWREPPRDPAAGAPPRVTPDRAAERQPLRFAADDVVEEATRDRPGERQPFRIAADDVPAEATGDRAGIRQPVRISGDAPNQATPVRAGGWQQRQEPPQGPAAGARHQPTPLSLRVRQRNGPALFGLVLLVTLGFLGWYFVSGSGNSPAGTPAAGSHPSAGASGPAPAGGGATSGQPVVVKLTAVRASSVVFTTAGGKYLFRATIAAGASKRWTFRHAVTMRVANPGGVRLLVDGKNPLTSHSAAHPVTLNLSPGHPATVANPAGTPTPAATRKPAVPLSTSATLTPASAASFGVSGPGQGDNQQDAPLAIDGRPGTAWNTDWYASARFGNLYPGTGLMLDMGRPVTITSAEISLGGAPGASFQLRVGSAPTLAGLPPVARAAHASGMVRLRLSTPARGRYVLIWFTKLPLTANGNFEASVYNVRLQGRT
jgi:transcriptional regulator with XRE-family HTH domain